MRSWLLLVAVLLPSIASAGHDISLGATTLSTTSFFRSSERRWALDATYAHETGPWRLGGGVRLAFPRGAASVPLEVYARALFTSRVGPWAPAVGPELGLSGLSLLEPETRGFPDDIDVLESNRLGAVYLAVHAAPLRFTFNRFTVSALEVQWGTTFPHVGGALRLHLGLLHLGMML